MKKGYLFVHFIGESELGEQIYFAVSEDGLHWQDLHNGEPVLISRLGECGVRDPFMIRKEDGTGFVLVATDLRIASGKGWEAAQYQGSRDLILWESEDLVHWCEPRAITVGIPEAGCVWAPEIIYDKLRKHYMIFFASMVQEPGEESAKQRIYCTKTKDFKTFSPTEKYMEKSQHVIDTTIIEEKGIYYRFSKNEESKFVELDASDDLEGVFHPIKVPALETLHGVEGPEIYPLEEGKWCLIVDRFLEGKGYLPLLTSNLANGDFRILPEGEYDMGRNKKRHGGVLELTQEEYQRLLTSFS